MKTDKCAKHSHKINSDVHKLSCCKAAKTICYRREKKSDEKKKHNDILFRVENMILQYFIMYGTFSFCPIFKHILAHTHTHCIMIEVRHQLIFIDFDEDGEKIHLLHGPKKSRHEQKLERPSARAHTT